MKRLQLIPVVAIIGLAACSEGPSDPTPTQFSQVDQQGQLVTFAGQIPEDFALTVAGLGGSVDLTIPQIGIAAVSGVDPSVLQAVGGVATVVTDEQWALDETPIAGAEGAEVGIESPATPNTASFYPRQWHLRAIGAQHAWAAGRRGSSAVKVAILDTGIDPRHRDTQGRVNAALSKSFVPSDHPVVAANFPGQPNWIDLHYHGTHVGATVASNAFAAAGVTSGVTLIAVKVLSRTGSGSTSGVLAGIVYAADVGADVINMSLGSSFLKKNAPGFISNFNRAMNYAHQKGTTVVVSAGNSNADMDHDGNGYKAYCSAPNVICVSATGPTSQAATNGPWTNIDAKAGYSNYGRSAVDVAAPGGNNASSVWAACNGFSLNIPICRTGTFVVGLQGTSMAAPHVSGLAALLVEKYGKNPSQIRAALQKGSDDLGQKGTDPVYGKGRINVPQTLGL